MHSFQFQVMLLKGYLTDVNFVFSFDFHLGDIVNSESGPDLSVSHQ